MVSPLMASMPMKAERAELLELMGLCMASHEEDLQQFGKKSKKTILNLSWKYKEQIVELESVGQYLAPRTGPSSFRPHWLLKTLGCREFDSALLEKPFDMSFDGEWKVMYVDIDKNDLTIDWNVWKFSSERSLFPHLFTSVETLKLEAMIRSQQCN